MSIDSEKAFMMEKKKKTLGKPEVDRILLTLIKSIYKNLQLTPNLILTD